MLVRLAGIEPAHPVPETSELCFMSIATRKRNETLCLWPGSAVSCEAIGACLRRQVRIVFTEQGNEYCRFT